ncbi:E3 SUMO-protein ligase SIZ1 [Platanthera guangdongensis]|uniref:E3 SUMO-protein ligase SIZ1 n=1 Tax=Platanthera guangdongensis TaxID=2320717 RepID=A0ABR2N2N8_9ASPA
MKIRCVCSGRLTTESMIQCEDSRCQVWQHIECVLIPDKPLEGIMPEIPSSFYCELCRLNRADPYASFTSLLLLFIIFSYIFSTYNCANDSCLSLSYL